MKHDPASFAKWPPIKFFVFAAIVVGVVGGVRLMATVVAQETRGPAHSQVVDSRADPLMMVAGHCRIGDSEDAVEPLFAGAASIRVKSFLRGPNANETTQVFQVEWTKGVHVARVEFVADRLVYILEEVNVPLQGPQTSARQFALMNRGSTGQPAFYTVSAGNIGNGVGTTPELDPSDL